MGKRFGRNQKRRMRAEIEKQTRAADYWAETAAEDRRIHRKAVRELEELREAAARLGHTALLQAEIHRVDSLDDHPRYLLRNPLGASETIGLSFQIGERIDQGCGTFDLHAFLVGADGRWTYRVTEDTLRRAGLLPWPRREILLRVVDELLNYVDRAVRQPARARDLRHG